MGFTLNYDLMQNFLKKYMIFNAESSMMSDEEPTVTLQMTVPGYVRLLSDLGVRFKRSADKDTGNDFEAQTENNITYDELLSGV